MVYLRPISFACFKRSKILAVRRRIPPRSIKERALELLDRRIVHIDGIDAAVWRRRQFCPIGRMVEERKIG